ncbi:MAG: hypothetical protein MJ016_01495 [Victivallaceae bacterium]|nr:hypothetical protein [Victivallaceae bacterium]
MLLFLGGIALLIVGYFTYGKVIEKIIGPDDRKTPAVRYADGVDYMVLPPGKAMLIQLLNIAGIGPVIGVILGIKYGTAAFWIIPVGNIFGGAVHDFVAAMMSMRAGGANLPVLMRRCCGRTMYAVMTIVMCFLLLLLVAVFINVPTQLIDRGIFPQFAVDFWIAMGVIFLYYVAATFFPIDQIIGRFYPVFGALLVLGSAAILVKLLCDAGADPSLLTEGTGFRENMYAADGRSPNPILPMLFVTIACGILSGFHATQSPIVVRTLKSEKYARPCFYGMMVLEGVIAMIWAGAALALYNLRPELMKANPNYVLPEITGHFLGGHIGLVTIISVIVLAITSGDTAMRSLRLSIAEIARIPQKKFINRVILCLPLIAITAGLLWWSNRDTGSFNILWNYFAWGNQVLAAMTLTAATVWLVSLKKTAVVTLIPGMFMTFIVTSYILWVRPGRGNGAVGFGMDLHISYAAGIAAAVIAAAAAVVAGLRKRQLNDPDWIGKKSHK